jgi:uncharacterized NAD(P)/FAD-binding protein YdhS
VASLTQRGHTGRITAFSRRGLLPRGHAKISAPIPFAWFGDHDPPSTVLSLLRQVRKLVAIASESDIPWQTVFDDIRANGQRLWKNFDETERRRFLRHLRVFWDAHRYRIAPQVEKILHDKRQNGSLQVLAASLHSINRNNKIDIHLMPRHRRDGEEVKCLSIDSIVVTTGPAHGRVVEHNPVLQSLAKQGLLEADQLRLGLRVDPLGQAIGRGGMIEPTLLVVGPLAREQYGELMGMPQVADQPNAVAEHLSARLTPLTPRFDPKTC